MDHQSLGQTLRYLRHLAAPVDGSRLDEELIERFVATRDEAAFASIIERHGPLVLGVCRRVLNNYHEAEDAFQATFLVLARNARHIRQREALAGWLYKVAYHLAVKSRASAERRRHAERQFEAAQTRSADDQIAWSELRRALDEELAQLPEKYRVPLLLCCVTGRTRDEAAEQLGWTLGTLKMRLERGRQRLRARLAQRDVAVSVVLMAMQLNQLATARSVPPVLATATTKASMLFAVGATSATISAQATRLAESTLTAGGRKSKLVGFGTLLVSLVGLAGGLATTPRPREVPVPDADAPILSPDGLARSSVPPAATGRFADATEESGLNAILSRHRVLFPDWHPTGTTLLDIDGDDQLDLHLAGQAEDFAALGLNTGGRFTYVSPRPEVPRGPRHHADVPYPGGQVRLAFDFNEDRKLDLAISWHNNGGTLYHNATAQGAMRFRRMKFVEPEFPDTVTATVADVNRDGIVDFLTSSKDTDIAVHLGRADGTRNTTPDVLIPTGLRCAGAIPVDLDGDGQLELIARQSDFDAPSRRKIMRYIGHLKWADVTREVGLGATGSVHGVGDLNQDGRPDLICMEGQGVVIYFNDGKGQFTRKADAIHGLDRAAHGPHSEWGDKWGGAVVVDFDNDGIPDVVVNGRFFLYVLRGTGGGFFEYFNDRWRLPDLAYCDVDDGLCFGDIDRDGRLDLVVANGHTDDPRQPLGLYMNRVTDHHWLCVRVVGKPGNASATGAKIRITEAGDPGRLIAYEQVAVWGRQSFHSYYAARQTERHFGLGHRTAVDVSVEFYPSGWRVERTNVPPNRTVVVTE